MNPKINCPVCKNVEGGSCTTFPSCSFECDVCGIFKMDRGLFEQVRAGTNNVGHWELSPVQRAVLSHRIRLKTAEGPKNESDLFMITPGLLESLRAGAALPSPTVQAANIVRFIGDCVSRSSELIGKFPVELPAIMGALTRESAVRLMEELNERGILAARGNTKYIGGRYGADPIQEPASANLTLDGWEQYESQERGSVEGNYGFIAMQFNESDLDDFVQNVVKPTVKTATGYDLVDMRDVPTAGVIDNIMRMRIREARFVIADLTHDNNGAYWEAGYAEGLGKPVIYICEQKKFNKKKSHFDTNHCTTVPWSRADVERFQLELAATLRQSLDLGG